MKGKQYAQPVFIPNINNVMSKPEQAKAILDYLKSLLKVSATAKTIEKQNQTAKESLIKHFPDLAQYV